VCSSDLDIRDKDFIILVEGYFDLLRLINEGVKNVVASSGTALSEQQAKLMSRYSKNIHIAYDGDGAGIKAAIRNAQIIENQEMNAYLVPMPEGDDPDTFVLENGIEAFRKLLKQKILPIEFQLDHYTRNNPNPSLGEKDQFILSVLNELINFKSNIKAGLYISHLADRMQVSESMLIAEINRLRKRQSHFNKTRDAFKDDTADTPEPEARPLLRGAHRAEEGLIEVLLNGDDEIQKYVLEHAGMDLFENELYAEIYGHILHDLEEHGLVDVHSLYDNPDISEAQSLLLTRLSMEEFTFDLKYAIDCVFQTKRWKLEKEAREIKDKIVTDSKEQAKIEGDKMIKIGRASCRERV